MIRAEFARIHHHAGARRALGAAALLLGVGVAGGRVAPYGPDDCRLEDQLAAPSAMHWLGANPDGCDLLSMLLLAAPVSLSVSLCVVVVTMTVGVLAGLFAGLRGGAADAAFLFVSECIQAFPSFLLAIAVAAVAPRRSLLVVVAALSVSGWVSTARLVRGQVLVLREADFVVSARALGHPELHVALREILPNLWGLLAVQASFGMASAMLAEAGLSFLGLGAAPGVPSWGAMLQEGRQYLLTDPGLAWAPGAAITGAVLVFNLLGDGVRDALSPSRSATASPPRPPV